MVGFVKPSKRGYFDYKQGAFGVMVWTEAGIPEGSDPLVSLFLQEPVNQLGVDLLVEFADRFVVAPDVS